ncbi:MAG: hypothetical protein Q9209_000117 [Squamulea sp. 1 TL-2023]
MPRRKVRPPPEDAVASSPLFQLSPEVRNMIYTYVLVDSDSHHSLFIPEDHFKRRRKEPAYRCDTCREGFGRINLFDRHRALYGIGEPCKPPMHKLPAISTAVLRSCRLANTEAASLLYRANTFYFKDPHALHSFRWKASTYSKLSAWVEEISIEICDTFDRLKDVALWQSYMTGSDPKKTNWRMSYDFPHLKRLIINLVGNITIYPPFRLQELCGSFRLNLAGLDWVHVIGLNSEDVVSSLKPMVCTTNSAEPREAQDNQLTTELERVQTHTTEYECASGWKNVTLWRGSHESRPPFIPSPLAGTGRERKHLFRFEMNGIVQFSAGSSFL